LAGDGEISEAGERVKRALGSAVAHQPSLACDYYLAVATGTDVIAAEAISVSGVALGTVNVNT